MKITDIARAIDPECVFDIIGIRPGEKMHESLIVEGEENVWLVGDGIKPCSKAYNSNENDQWLNEKEFLKLLIQ